MRLTLNHSFVSGTTEVRIVFMLGLQKLEILFTFISKNGTLSLYGDREMRQVAKIVFSFECVGEYSVFLLMLAELASKFMSYHMTGTSIAFPAFLLGSKALGFMQIALIWGSRRIWHQSSGQQIVRNK